MTRPSLACFSASALLCGIEATQGPHQVAQMSSSTVLPRKSESFISLPSGPTAVKSGARSPAWRPGRVRVAGAEVGTVSVPWAVMTAGRKATQAARSRGMFFMERETD
jgi:hypothetical protein